MSSGGGATPAALTRLTDIVFPGDANHHGTLFGGIALARMDKAAFIAASRHAPVDFVTASCESIDFVNPAHVGDIVEVTAHVVRVNNRSLGVQAELMAESPLSGEQRQCSLGIFNMVAVGCGAWSVAEPLPSLEPAAGVTGAKEMCDFDIVFPDQTSHYGSLYGGDAFALMGKAAFVQATRRSRRAVVLASTRHVTFFSQVHTGEIVELRSSLAVVGRRSITVAVELWAEDPRERNRRRCGTGEFVMVAVGADHRPVDVTPTPPLANA